MVYFNGGRELKRTVRYFRKTAMHYSRDTFLIVKRSRELKGQLERRSDAESILGT